MKYFSKPLLYVLAAAFLLRLVWMLVIYFLNPDGIWVYDSFGYWYLGNNLLEHSIFSQNSAAPFELDHFRTPLYPIFLSFFQWMGTGNFVIVFIQLLLSVFTCFFTYHIGMEVFQKEKVALLSAWIMALDVPSVIFSNFILTETLFGFLFIVCCWTFLRYLRYNEGLSLVCSALFCGAIILCRPIGIFIPFIQLGILIFFKRKNLWSIPLFTLLVLAVVSPWLIRNKSAFGEYSLSSLPSHNLLNHHAANLVAERENISFETANINLRMEMLDKFKGDALQEPFEYARFIRNEAIGIISEDPGIFIEQHLKNVAEFFIKPVRSYVDLQLGRKDRSVLTLVLVGFQILLLVAIYIGFIPGILLLKDQKQVILFIILLILYFSNMTVPPFSESRFRIPVMPLIALVGAAGLFKLYSGRRGAMNENGN